MTHRLLRAAIAVVAAASLTTCGDADRVFAPADRLGVGTWGGDGAGVIVEDSLAHVHVGCTFGDFPGKVSLDAAGRFTADGRYVLRAYPVFIGPYLPAQFSGQVDGDLLVLAIAVNDTVSGKVVSLGPVAVRLGREPKLGPCPICSVAALRSRLAAAP